MIVNYFTKKFSRSTLFLQRNEAEQKPKSFDFAFGFLLLVLTSVGMNAQTQLIPVSDGSFETGNTFAANGWTVANEGSGAVKWVVGTAVNSGAITGNSAYVSLDGGETNSYAGISGARAIFFYRDIVIPAGQTNIALTFNWKSVGNSSSTWQVFAAPTSYTPVGLDTQLSVPATIAGTSSVAYGSVNAVTQKAFGFIPPSYAGTTVRLIFMWSNGNGGGTNQPAAIDNISLVSRVGGSEIASVQTGNYTDAATWDAGYVPSSADDVVINGGHTVTIDNRNLGVNNMYIAGANAVVDFGVLSDEFTINNDLLISGSGARFNVYNGTTGKSLKVGHNIDIVSSGRLDISVGSSTVGAGGLTLFGSELQTISSDGTGLIGGTVTSTTTTNTVDVINQLTITNTSTAIPNIDWQLNNVRIKNALRLNTGKIGLGTNKMYIGNFASMFSSNFICSLGGGFIGGEISRWYTTSAMGANIDPGIDYNPNSTVLFPFLSDSGQNRWAFLISSAATTAGELAMSYDDASTMTTGLSVLDGSYTITDRFNGNWTVSKAGSTYASTGTYTLGLYATGAYNALDGSSRIMNSTSVVGTHTNGTTSPFVVRKNIADADLTTSPFYVGIGLSSVQGTTTKTSVASGNWNDAATWSPSGVPSCSDVITIANGHTVTVNSAGNNAAGVTINLGGTLVNASGSLTVGCTNNNAVFSNNGVNTVSGGTLTVNGSVVHIAGSTFSQTGGDIIVDSNNAGDATTSVGQGGSSFKLNTSNVTLTGGKITIVDPLVNNTVATTATSGNDFVLTTNVGSFEQGVNTFAAGATSIAVPGFFTNINMFGVGQQISGPGIQPGTTITGISALVNISLTLSLPTIEAVASATLTFSSMANGQKNIVFPTGGDFISVAVGQQISGPGIPAGTTVVSAGGGSMGIGGITLSQPVSGLTTSPIEVAQEVTLSAVSSGSSVIILSAVNPAIIAGQAVAGTGVQPGTTVTAVNGTKLDMSLPLTGVVTSPLELTFYDGNLNSYSFAYNSSVNIAAGLNHTLQIGDGISTDKAAVTINGFYCNLAQGGGILSLGNLTVDALDGNNRFFNVVNGLFIQNTATITSGSVFKKTNTTTGICFGGNVVNNGSIFVGTNPVYLASAYSSTTFSAVPTSLPQTISGTGSFYNNLNPALSTGSLSSLTVNNTNPAGVTIAIPNFRISSGITMNAGIIHTSEATPLYHGVVDLSNGGFATGNFGPTCFIDGPYEKVFATTATSANLTILPIGKTTYTPISIGVSGGGILNVEAFDTNTGTSSANISELSATRWKVTREGTAGNFTDFRVALGDSPITSSHFVVQAATDQGTYDDVLGASVFTASTPTTVNTLAMSTAQPSANFTGNFAYALAANCTAVNPGNTIADTTIIQVVTTQNSSATGIVSGSANVTLQAANTGIVVGLTVTGAGIPAGTTVLAISGTTLTLSDEATLSSSSQTALTFSNVITSTSLCNSQTVTLSLENEVEGSGITYQWQSSVDDGANYTDISGATASTYVATPTGDTFYRCVVTCTYGSIVANSTPVEITFTNAITSTTPVTICEAGVATLEATASSGTINWYENATGGVAIATGATYAPTLSETTTYYVAAENTSNYTAGKTFAGTGTQSAPFSGLIFNTSTNIRLNSVKVHPKQIAGAADAGAPITIKLYDKNGVQVPGTTAVTFTPETNVGTVSATISNTVVLNYDIPAGSGYKLLATNGLSSNNSLGRLSSFPATTPTVSGAISFTASANSFDGTTEASYNNFFDWDVTEFCSSSRVAVTATVGCAPVQDCATIGTATTTAVTCFGGNDGSATITMSAETPSVSTISYTVNGGTSQNATLVDGAFDITGLTVGTHSVVVSNVGCPDVTVSVSVTGPTSVLTNSTTETACNSYTWSVTGLTYSTGGTYTGTTTNDDGCTVNETLELTINTAATPTGDANQTVEVEDVNDATLADLVVSPSTVVWYASEADALAGENPLAIDAILTQGATYYAVNETAECSSTPLAVTVTVTLDARGFDDVNFSYYPNPTSGILFLSYSQEITKVTVVNTLGQIMMESKGNGNQTQVDLSSLPSATYFVKVESNNKSKTVKVIKVS
jgi:hypothetical protein